MGNKFIAKRIAALSVAGALMLSMPMVEEVPFSAISVTASAASTRSTYTQEDLDRLISTHDAFVKKFGKSAYLYRVTSDKTTMKYTLEVQRSLNFLSNFFGINDDTPEDSKYGPDARALCKKVQKKLKVEADSYFGPGSYSATVAKLKDILKSQNVSNSSEFLVPAEDIYIYQYGYFKNEKGSSKACTLSSCGMLIRAFGAQHGINPSEITEKELWDKGWTSNGCKSTFTVNGITVKTQGIATSKQCYNDPDKTAQYIKRVLSSHKEGIVLYCWKNNTKAEHAVYLSADTSNGWTILDPANGRAEYIPMKESENWISQNIANVSQIWYIGELND